MRIENLVRLVEGKLHTSPAVSTANGIVFNPENAKQGDIFVCEDRLQGSLELAVAKGAFALIADKSFVVTDKEIAWIEVDNLDLAMVRLARFLIAKHKLSTYFTSSLELDLAKSMNPPKEILLLEDNLSSLLSLLFQGDKPSAIISSNLHLLKKISPQYLALPNTLKPALTLSLSTLFQSSFVFEGRFYKNLFLPPFWIDSFTKLASLFTPLNWRFSSLRPFGHFVPIFVNAHLVAKSFGSTTQALIVEPDVNLFLMQAKYLKKNYPKISIKTCAPAKMDLGTEIDFAYNSIEDLLNLNPQTFRYAPILEDPSIIESLLQEKKSSKQSHLF